ncbi:3-oxoadipate enol-lactonase [Sphingomonas vulcanisoli]|uniref:3-oxoadipate enol-lactonase n=1 Tax=Sphingomonas vulcanisoli TaxID=1658060 RepID=A0ABX0TP48_9SPHN|nr:alpha/beta fold hydrolase [Sphingomonas vulcanisoli]NIJ07313.1 3-oxoadipate enol-lactonase [Sphingomonas vulcanisoli]
MPFGQVRDINLYYEVVGSGPRLLFINGTGADLRRKQPYVDTLNDHFTVLRYDQRGLGQTEKPDRHYSMADYADDAAALMDLVGWDRAAVLGVSFGGSVAQELARRHPDRITRLALACANPGGPYGYPLLDLHHKDPETRARTMMELDLRKTPEWQAANPEKARELIEQGMKRGGGNTDPNAAMGARRQLEAREEHDAREWIDQIRLPVGLFGGRYDGLGTVEGQEFMAERIKGSELRLFEGAHGFLNEDKAAVPAITEFLTRAS